MQLCPVGGMSRPWPSAGFRVRCLPCRLNRSILMHRRPGCRVSVPRRRQECNATVTDETNLYRAPRLYRATPADAAVMAAIHAAAFPAHDAWQQAVFSQHLALPGIFGLLHPSGGLILVRVVADEAEILTLAVIPEARRSGIATALLHESTMTASAMGAAAVFLEVSVANSAALAVYTRAGFRPVGRRRAYYSDRSDALVLRLDAGDPG